MATKRAIKKMTQKTTPAKTEENPTVATKTTETKTPESTVLKATPKATDKAVEKAAPKTIDKAVEKAAVKPATKKAEVKKPVVKKPAVKKPVAKKAVKTSVIVEYYGKQVEEKTMIANVKKAWTKKGKRVGDIKTIELYVKPEENAVYYVINGTETGGIEF